MSVSSLSQGLSTDFGSEHGSHHLQIDRNPKLSDNDFNPIQVHMLRNNVIPKLLHVEFENMDHNIRLLYDISGKKMLAHRLKREKLTQGQYLTMMLHAVSLLVACPGYMLDCDKVILHKDYIFTGPDITDLYFTYIPLKEYTGTRMVQEQLREFSGHCMASVLTMEGDLIPQVLAFMRDDTIQLVELKEYLLTLALADSDCTVDEDKLERLPIANPETPIQLTQRSPWVPKSITPSLPNAILTNSKFVDGDTSSSLMAKRPLTWFKRIQELKDEVGPSSETGELPSNDSQEKPGHTMYLKKNAYLLIASTALVCFIWSFYSDQSSIMDLLFLIGGSVAIGAILVFVLRARPRWLYGELQQVQEESSNPLNESLSTIYKPLQPIPVTVQTQIPVPRENLTLPQPYLATVLLDSSLINVINDSVNPIKYPTLEIEGDIEGELSIVIDKASFIIGREGSGADFVLKSTGVSKFHLELIKYEGGWNAQDLGSTNGTLLNGVLMVPYKAYHLTNADKLRILETQFVFKTT